MTQRFNYGNQGGGRPPGKGPPSQPGGEGAGLPADYLTTLRKGYFNDDGYILEKFIVDYPKAIADVLEEGDLKRAQLRNFYGEVADIRHLLRAGQPFEGLRGRILKLEAHASNAVTRRTDKAPEVFGQFLTENARAAAKDKHSFLDGFSQHFECLVLFFRGRR